MQGMFRRRNPPEDDDIIEGVIQDDSEEIDNHATLERVAPDIPTPDEMALTPFVRTYERETPPKAPRRLKVRLPKLLVWEEVRPSILLVATGLISVGIFWTLHNRGQTASQIDQLAPLLLLAFALIWSIYALVTARPTTFLAATTLVGISISFWLDMQDLIAWHKTFIGAILITVGIGIMARGLVLRGTPS